MTFAAKDKPGKTFKDEWIRAFFSGLFTEDGGCSALFDSGMWQTRYAVFPCHMRGLLKELLSAC
jgi:hypothetical protein